LLSAARPQRCSLLLHHSSLHSINQLLDVVLVYLSGLFLLSLGIFLFGCIKASVSEMGLNLLNGSRQLRRDAHDLLVVRQGL